MKRAAADTVYDIQIANEQSALEFDAKFIQSVARAVLMAEKVASARISIAVVTDELIHGLNRRHLNHDYPTDVLSFPLGSEVAQLPMTESILEGELIVSADTAMREAGLRAVPPIEELALYVVHGMLHLCGYDDHENDDRETMRQRERLVLSQFDIVPQYD